MAFRLPTSKRERVIERHSAGFIAQPDLRLPPSNLTHGLHLPRREFESHPSFTVAAGPRPEAQSPLTVNLGALGEPWGCGAHGIAE
jgi:hypothetical protein